jgi:hypothetical protein
MPQAQNPGSCLQLCTAPELEGPWAFGFCAGLDSLGLLGVTGGDVTTRGTVGGSSFSCGSSETSFGLLEAASTPTSGAARGAAEVEAEACERGRAEAWGRADSSS